jgi:hypothetical protein
MHHNAPQFMRATHALVLSPSLTLVWLALVTGVAFSAPQDVAQPAAASTIEAPVTSVALFKNGLAIVQRTATLPGGGRFELDAVPDAVHGTLWVQCATPLDVRSTEREVELPTDGRWDRDPAREFAGCWVRIRLRGEPATDLSGRVARMADPKAERGWSRSFEQSHRWDHWGNMLPMTNTLPSPVRSLALDTNEGRTFVDLSMIAFMHVADPPETRTETRHVMELTAPAGAPRSTAVLTYLTKGLSFAPSYRLDIADPMTLKIAETAVLRNELEDLTGVEVELISGFPSMEYSHVMSPLSPATTWATFFAQLSQEFDSSRGNRSAMTQNAVSISANYGDAGGSAIQPASEGVDLHYQSIGKRDLREGEALHVHVASAATAYERIVEWRIRDTRDEWGRPIQQQSWERTNDKDEDGAWDALRFDNPFAFPMTTAPATIVSGAKFQGQRTTSWVNPGEETTVRVTKALAVRTTTAEYEVETGADREVVVLGGRSFRRVGVKGELQLCNHRKEAVQMVIRREFSGELSGAQGEPETKLLERGVYSVNRRQELVWTLTLAPGEEKRVEYTYDVLVHH